MAELKTKATDQSVAEFIKGIEDDAVRNDCDRLLGMMKKATGEQPKMWGSSIVGFGSYRYRYSTGKEGEWFKVGFAPRKKNLTLYLMSGFTGQSDLLSRLGKHTTGKGCLYVKSLEGIDEKVLTELIDRSLAFVEAQSVK
ncbi:MAG TPA: DUF1801 domain-containing protein [Acidimicrobiia bacterium]